MKSNELHQQIEFPESTHPPNSPSSLTYKLITKNMQSFRNLTLISLSISAVRIIFFFIIMTNQQYFIATQSNSQFSDSWNVIFYILTSLMDFLTILNDIGNQQRIKNNSWMVSIVLQHLLAIIIIIAYKFTPRSSSSISETIRYLHIVITFYSFGNLAVNAQNKNHTSLFKCSVLWAFILSIYFTAFQIDFTTMQGSTGPYSPLKQTGRSQIQQLNNEGNESYQEIQIKHRFLNKCRKPFEMMFIVNILAMLGNVILFFQADLLNLMLVLCILMHMVQLIHQKYLQNRLIALKINNLPYASIIPFKLLASVSNSHKTIFLFIRSLTRYSIFLTLLAYFRLLSPSLTQSFSLFFLNILLVTAQYIKFAKCHKTKLYVLQPIKHLTVQPNHQCAICLISCNSSDSLLKLPCFSNHIYHFKCMKNWFKQRKQCPLCRYSLQIYDIE